MNKEQIYDEQINPLMAQILAICAKHEIPHVCSFHIPNDEDDDLCCTSINTTLPATPQVFKDAVKCLRAPSASVMMITETRPDGGKTLTAVIG